MMLRLLIIGLLLIFGLKVEAKIRLRKVKDSQRTCAVMKEDLLLSRPAKPVWSTERHSIVVADDILLVNDLGQKICTWDKAQFSTLGEITKFRFYIDEYKEIIYPYIADKDKGFIFVTTPFKSCSLEKSVNVSKVEYPKCEKPKRAGKNSKKKKV